MPTVLLQLNFVAWEHARCLSVMYNEARMRLTMLTLYCAGLRESGIGARFPELRVGLVLTRVCDLPFEGAHCTRGFGATGAVARASAVRHDHSVLRADAMCMCAPDRRMHGGGSYLRAGNGEDENTARPSPAVDRPLFYTPFVC